MLIESMGSGHQRLERALAAHGVLDDVAPRVPQIVAGTDLVASLPSRVDKDAANQWLRPAMAALFGDRPGNPRGRRS